jgi:recombination protein RecA
MKPQELMNAINKSIPGAVRLGSDSSIVTENLSTGVLPIDYLLRGGLPRNRMVEIYGDFSTLKSYVGLCAIATTQRAGGTCALVDTEHAYDPSWAQQLGVDITALILQQPPNGETAVDTAELLIRSGIDLLVFDSVAATLPRAEQEIKISGDKSVQPARLAALMSLALRKLTAANSRTAVLWINQTREAIGVTYGNPERVPGGKALPFYASARISLRKAGRRTTDVSVFDGQKNKTIKRTDAVTIRAFTEKSKLDKPYKECYFEFDLSRACVDDLGFLINLGLEKGIIIRKAGGIWQMKNGQLVKGLEKFREEVDRESLANSLDLMVLPGKSTPLKRKVGWLKGRS